MIERDDLVPMDICHGSEVRKLEVSKPIDQNALRSVDAIVSRQPGIALLLSTADCNPVFFWDPVTRQCALAHIGWRGVVAQLANKVIVCMTENGHSSPSNISVSIGPSIGPCCYKIANPDQLQFPEWKPYLFTDKAGVTAIDLWAPVRDQLLQSGVCDDNIDISKICTSCNVDRFFSYWVDKPRTGRFASVIMFR